MASAAFAKMATVTGVSTRRSPAVSGGKRGEPVENLTGITCSPLDPADPGEEAQLQQQTGSKSPLRLKQTYVDASLDIVEGDILVVGGTEYQIRAAAPWTWRRTSTSSAGRYLRLLLEEQRSS
jgi:hypothetical protein